MTVFRRLSYATLTLAFAQIVFGAIVRITGSGLGCGNHWPKCDGAWFPPHDRVDLIIEITHRYIAAALTVAILLLLYRAFRQRHQPGVGGRGGVFRPLLLAAGLVLTAAVFGAVTVKMDLNPYIIVTHLSIAMTLLGVLALTAVRAGGFGVDRVGDLGNRASAARTFRAGRGAVGLAFVVLILGALTANVVGANRARVLRSVRAC
jgi:heme A synthase